MNFTRNYAPMWRLGCAGLGVKETLEFKGRLSVLSPKWRLKALLNNLRTFSDQLRNSIPPTVGETMNY